MKITDEFLHIFWIAIFCSIQFRGQFNELIYTLRQTISALCPTFEKLFTGAKVWHKAQKIGKKSKTAYEINPWSNVSYFHYLAIVKVD